MRLSRLQKTFTIHFVYPYKEKARTPDAIGFNLAKKLREHGYKVISYSLYELSIKPFKPTSQDILLGHPRWESNNTFLYLLKMRGWGRVIILHPFCPLDLWNYAHLYFYCIFADRFIAITGKYWEKEVGNTFFSDWEKKFLQVDLALDQKYFPKIKHRFNVPGKRKFIFIGNHPYYKNVSFLNELAGHLKHIEFHRIGPPGRKFTNLIQHGAYELSSPEAVNIIKDMDFMITTGIKDANPTTVIEASSLGLIAVCPVGSGYYEKDGVFNISGDDLNLAIEQINKLNFIDEAFLIMKRKQMTKMLKTRYTWSNFSKKIIKEIEAKDIYNYEFSSFYKLLTIYLVYYILARKSPWRILIKKFIYRFRH